MRATAAALLLVAFAAHLRATVVRQELPPGYERHYDSVVDATTESLRLATDSGPVSVRIAVVYAGERREACPRRVEVVIASDGTLIGDARTIELAVVLRVDGQPVTYG